MQEKLIDDVRTVNDLAEGQIAVPEEHMAYVVYPIGGGTELPVEKVVRLGDHLYAISDAGEHCIAGDDSGFAIRGRYKTKAETRVHPASSAGGSAGLMMAAYPSNLIRSQIMAKKTTTKTTTAKTTTAKKAAPKKAPAKKAALKSPAKTAAPEAAENAKPTKTPAEPKQKKLSALDAAAQVLAASKEPMNSKEMIEAMAAKGLWSSPGGKTPHATLYSAILREIKTKGAESRFTKTERGKFASNG